MNLWKKDPVYCARKNYQHKHTDGVKEQQNQFPLRPYCMRINATWV